MSGMNEEILKKHSDDELFDNFIISYDSEEKEQITKKEECAGKMQRGGLTG